MELMLLWCSIVGGTITDLGPVYCRLGGLLEVVMNVGAYS